MFLNKVDDQSVVVYIVLVQVRLQSTKFNLFWVVPYRPIHYKGEVCAETKLAQFTPKEKCVQKPEPN